MRTVVVVALSSVVCLAVGCTDEPGAASTSSPSGAGGTAGQGAATGSGASGASGPTTGSGAGGGNSGDAIPAGGTVLFEETFEDTDFNARGWYDGSGAISTDEHVDGSTASFECTYSMGATGCDGGTPARHLFTESETVYLAFHIKLSGNWQGSGQPYHPHMFHFITNEDDQYVGPANSHLTTYTEIVDGQAMLAIQDSRNVDTSCILRNDDSFVGCDGDFGSYVFTEDRSVAACNGLVGEVDGRDCFDNGYWYSSRAWRAARAVDDAWHFVEIYFEMNSIVDGIGVPDGKIRWVEDGEVVIASDEILLRTGSYPTMAFNQFAMLPYIGDGSPVVQSFWVDDLVVATARPD